MEWKPVDRRAAHQEHTTGRSRVSCGQSKASRGPGSRQHVDRAQPEERVVGPGTKLLPCAWGSAPAHLQETSHAVHAVRRRRDDWCEPPSADGSLHW